MLFDGIKLVEGSEIQNMTVASGTSFPASPDQGELFYRTDAPNDGLYVYDGAWTRQANVDDLAGLGSDYTLKAGNETVSGTWSFNNSVTAADPSSASHLTTKSYVDSAINGLSWKNSVKAATTANITLSGAQTIDGVSVVATDRVLVKNQTTASENGVYVVASGAWTRATDFDSISPIDEINSAAVFVQQGTTQADTGWTQISTVATVGTDSMSFVQFSGAGSYVAGSGLSLSGLTFNVGTASASRIVVNADDIDLATTGTPGTYTSVTTDAYGRVTAGTNPPASAAAANLTGTTLAANVVSSSLTSVGTLASLDVTGNVSAADPTTATHLTTKQYVDSAINGLSWKLAATAATTANITLSGTQTIDGVAVTAGQRVLVKNQSTAANNGIYVVAAGAWARATDADSAAELDGAAVYVQQGTVNADTAYTQTTTIVTVGSTSQTWTQFASTAVNTAVNLAGGVANRIPFQSAASTTAFSADFTYDDSTKTLSLATGGLNSIITSAASGQLFLRSANTTNANSGGVFLTTGTCTTSGIAGNITLTTGNFASGSGGNINLTCGVRTGTAASGAITLTASQNATGSGTAGAVTINGGASTTGGSGGAVTISGGAPGTSSGNGGAVNLSGGSGSNSGTGGGGVSLNGGGANNSAAGAINITAGNAGTGGVGAQAGGAIILQAGNNTAATGPGGAVTITAGASNSNTGGAVNITSGSSAGSSGGAINITGGPGNGNTGGIVTISAGVSSTGVGGHVILQTGPTTTLVERLRILRNGAWSVGTGGTATGTSGQVLTSTGATTPPTWQTAAGGGGSPAVVIVSGTTQAATANNEYVLTNTGATTTVTLPASPADGDTIWVTNNTTRTDAIIARNGNNIQRIADDITFNTLNRTIQLRYISSLTNWQILN